MIKRILPILLSIYFLFFGALGVFASDLMDNFDDGNFNGWIEYASWNAPLCASTWSVDGGVLKAIVSQPSCSTNLYPDDSLWGDIGSQYQIELDMWMVSGIDHNIALRFRPSDGKYYEYHFFGSSRFTFCKRTL